MPSLTRLTTGGVLNPLKNTTNTSHNELLHQEPLQPPLEPRQRPSERPERPDAYGYVISRAEASGAPRVLEPRTGTLRGVHTLTTTYTNEAGEVVASFERHQNWKSVFDPFTTEVPWVEREHESTALDPRSEAYKDLPDGEYALTVSAHNDGPSRTEQSGLRVKMCVWLGVSRGLDLAFLNAD